MPDVLTKHTNTRNESYIGSGVFSRLTDLYVALVVDNERGDFCSETAAFSFVAGVLSYHSVTTEDTQPTMMKHHQTQAKMIYFKSEKSTDTILNEYVRICFRFQAWICVVRQLPRSLRYFVLFQLVLVFLEFLVHVGELLRQRVFLGL